MLDLDEAASVGFIRSVKDLGKCPLRAGTSGGVSTTVTAVARCGKCQKISCEITWRVRKSERSSSRRETILPRRFPEFPKGLAGCWDSKSDEHSASWKSLQLPGGDLWNETQPTTSNVVVWLLNFIKCLTNGSQPLIRPSTMRAPPPCINVFLGRERLKKKLRENVWHLPARLIAIHSFLRRELRLSFVRKSRAIDFDTKGKKNRKEEKIVRYYRKVDRNIHRKSGRSYVESNEQSLLHVGDHRRGGIFVEFHFSFPLHARYHSSVYSSYHSPLFAWSRVAFSRFIPHFKLGLVARLRHDNERDCPVALSRAKKPHNDTLPIDSLYFFLFSFFFYISTRSTCISLHHARSLCACAPEASELADGETSREFSRWMDFQSERVELSRRAAFSSSSGTFFSEIVLRWDWNDWETNGFQRS